MQPTARDIALAPVAINHACTQVTARPYSYYHGPIHHWDGGLWIIHRNRPVEVVPMPDDHCVPFVAK